MKHTLILAFIFQKLSGVSLSDFFKTAQQPSVESALVDLQTFFAERFVSPHGIASDKLKAWIDEAQAEYFRDLGFGIDWVCPMDSSFPSALFRLDDPVFLLRYRGCLDWAKLPALAVVGTREPHSQSLQWMEEVLPRVLKNDPLAIVSGGARGVDQAAHRIAIRSQVPTVSFVPSGLRRVYPQSLENLIEPILESGGAVISEYSSLLEMRKFHFIQRNRLIAGLGLSTLLVQAGRRSGTLLTARCSLDQGKPVFVVPSHPLDVKSHGGLDLLIEGASMVRDAEDLKLLIDSEIIGYTRDSGPLFC